MKSDLTFRVTEDGKNMIFPFDGEGPVLAKHSDFWRMHLDDGEFREITVHSGEQRGKVCEKEGETIITYSEIQAENGKTYDISLNVHIVRKEEGIEYYAEIENHDTVRVNELQLPYLEFERFTCEPEDEVLLLPLGLGAKYKNPREYIQNQHTEYMRADNKGVYKTFAYPAPLSMCWLGIQSGDSFFYLSRQDEKLRICSLVVGTPPRSTEQHLILTVSHYPMAGQGESITTPPTLAAFYKGDFTEAAQQYRAWADSAWHQPAEKPDWIKHMTGWHRVILKHQYGEILFRYDDLPKLYRENAKYGIHTLMVFGWWKGRFDNGYPKYEADPALGGEEGLKKAIEEVHGLGGRVMLYSNGKLIDVKSDFYQETGRNICQMDIDGNEYREHYQFANCGTVLSEFGYKSFVTGCQATDEWQEKLLDTAKIKLSFQPDSIFFDQIGGCLTRLCFDEHHKHGKRPDEEAVYRLSNIEAIKKLLKGDQAIGTEHVTDVFSTRFHYIHGCNTGCWPSEEACPELFRSVFPELIVSDRFMHDEKDFRRRLNHAFVYGLIFDISVYRGRGRFSDIPHAAAYLKEIIALKEQYRRFFYDGKFVYRTKPVLPEQVKGAEYVFGQERMFALWNDSNETMKFDFLGEQITMSAQSVTCICK